MAALDKSTTCIFLCILLSAWNGQAQIKDPGFLIGFSAGTFIYQGDLTPAATGSYKTPKPVVNIYAAKFIHSFFSVRGNLSIGSLKGDDSRYEHPEYRQFRNFKFSSPVVEISALGEWNIAGKNFSGRGIAPYVFAGIGFSLLNIERDASGLNTAYFNPESEVVTGLQEDMQRRLPGSLVVFPVGVGARYFFSDRFGVSAETSYRVASTDFLDGFSRSANPSRRDHYYSHAIGLVYRPGMKNRFDCPQVPY